MSEKGIENVYALLGGTQAWKNAGYPMEGSGTVPGQPAANVATPAPSPVRTAPQLNANNLKDTPKP